MTTTRPKAATELEVLRASLTRWRQRLLASGLKPQAVDSIRLAVELDPGGDGMAVPLTARAFVPPSTAARALALARYCIEGLGERNTALWRERREQLRRLDELEALSAALEPEVLQARSDALRRSEGGRKGGQARHADNDTRNRVAAEYQRQIGRPPRERAKRIAIALQLEVATVRYHLRALGLSSAQS